MRPLNTLSLLIGGLLVCGFASCGPSDAEVELWEMKAQAAADSLQVVQEANAKLFADSLAKVDARIIELEQALIMTKADLVTAEDRLSRVSQVQFLRARWEREQQIHDATVAIEESKVRVEKLEEAVSSWKDYRDKLRKQGFL